LSFSKRTRQTTAAERDRHAQIALVHAVGSIAAGIIDPATGNTAV
jgi:hypothetical protein